jgi:hypothetical protein
MVSRSLTTVRHERSAFAILTAGSDGARCCGLARSRYIQELLQHNGHTQSRVEFHTDVVQQIVLVENTREKCSERFGRNAEIIAGYSVAPAEHDTKAG